MHLPMVTLTDGNCASACDLGEIIDTIGVPPDYQRPLSAADVSTGKDPAMDQAVSLIDP
ncbi:hypothetical protein [Actinomadura luteofluorescens]